MKNIKKISYAAALLVVTGVTSCKKQLDEFNPHAGTAENLWTTPAGFTTLVNSAYQELHFLYGQEDGFFLLETGTDLWYSAGRSGYAKQYVYYEALAPGQSQHTKAWTSFYKSINLCNAGISRIDDAHYTNDTEKKNRLGELYFLRALYNYHLVEQFGNVILKTKESADGVDLYPKRNTIEEFYEVIISDLITAKDYLPVSWPAGEYSRATKKAAAGMLAKAYLTRAYYSSGADAQGYFTKAKDAAVDLINNRASYGTDLFTTFAEVGASVNALPQVNRASNKEALFVLAYSQDNSALNALTGANGNRIFKWGLTKYRDRPGMDAVYVNAYGVDNEQRVMPTWHLLDLYDETIDARYNASFQETWISNKAWTWLSTHEPAKNYAKDPSVVGKTIAVNDTAMYLTKKELGYDGTVKPFMAIGRKELYVNPVHNQGAAVEPGKVITNYFPSFRKFVNPNRTWTGTTDFGDAMIMRLAEVYLIAAEAYIGLNDATNALPYVNRIRERAAVSGQTAAMRVNASDLNVEFILDERARELAGELTRWYDLKRVYHDKTKWANYIKKWNPDINLIEPYHWLRPVPQTELQALLNAKEFDQNEGYPKPL